MIDNSKVSKKELMNLLKVSYPTARKEYQTIIDSLQIKRNYLTQLDLQNYGFRLK